MSTDAENLSPEQIDRRLAEAVGQQVDVLCTVPGFETIHFRPSSDIAHAFLVVDWMQRQGWGFRLIAPDSLCWQWMANFMKWRLDIHYEGIGDTPEEAISVVALAALEAEQS